MMYSPSQFRSSVNNDVTIIENFLSEEPSVHSNIQKDSNSHLYPGQTSNYQIPKPVQLTSSSIGLRPNISQIYSNNSGNILRHNNVQNQSQHLVPSGKMMQNRHCFGNMQQHQKSHQMQQQQINYVKTKSGLKAVSKRKRKRTMFTTEQVAVLEKIYLSKPYINLEERKSLVEALQMNDKVIKVWFQNRRLKEKRDAYDAEQELYSPDDNSRESNYTFDELSYVKSLMNQTDEFGYVTLDTRAMNELVNAIDNALSYDAPVDLSEELHVGHNHEEESKPVTIYEPISPASSECVSSEESSSTYEPFEPEESLQRIFDIQEFLIFNK